MSPSQQAWQATRGDSAKRLARSILADDHPGWVVYCYWVTGIYPSEVKVEALEGNDLEDWEEAYTDWAEMDSMQQSCWLAFTLGVAPRKSKGRHEHP